VMLYGAWLRSRRARPERHARRKHSNGVQERKLVSRLEAHVRSEGRLRSAKRSRMHTVKHYLEHAAPVRVEVEPRTRPVWSKVAERLRGCSSSFRRLLSGPAANNARERPRRSLHQRASTKPARGGAGVVGQVAAQLLQKNLLNEAEHGRPEKQKARRRAITKSKRFNEAGARAPEAT
jgi:hypothetical protein